MYNESTAVNTRKYVTSNTIYTTNSVEEVGNLSKGNRAGYEL